MDTNSDSSGISTSSNPSGISRNRAQGFKEGNAYWRNRTFPEITDGCSLERKRVSASDFPIEMFCTSSDDPREHKGLVRGPDGSLKRPDLDVTCLRPLPAEKTVLETFEECAPTDENVILNKELTADLFHQASKEHVTMSPECHGKLVFNDNQSRQWGLAWQMSLSCNVCTYISNRKKLYREVEENKRGRKAAAINRGLQVGLSKNRVANYGAREIITSVNVRPPYRSGMQKNSNIVGKKLVEANERNMSAIRNKLKDTNEYLGRARNRITAEGDSTYNNNKFSGVGKTPFQSGTQTTLVVCENLTPSKRIIAVETNSKLCTCFAASCYGPHLETCCATIGRDDSIGNEGTYLKNALHKINSDELFLDRLIVDGDSNTRSEGSAFVQSDGSHIDIEYCTRHMTRNLERRLSSTNFSSAMFPGKSKKEKSQAQTRFAMDVGDRVQAEFAAAVKHHGPDPPSLSIRLMDIASAIINCYKGDCTGCKKSSFVCQVDGKMYWRSYLDTNSTWKQRRAFIRPTDSDILKLSTALSIRFSREAINGTLLNATQNKSESVMHSIKKSVPNQMTFKRNYPSRVHSQVHGLNNLPGTSIALLCNEVAAPLNKSVLKACKEMDLRANRDKIRQKLHKYIESRSSAREFRYGLWDNKHRKQYTEFPYQRGAVVSDVLKKKPKEKSTRNEHVCRVCKKKFISRHYLLLHKVNQKH